MSRSSSSSMSRSGSKAFGMSSYSINKSGPMNRIAKTNLKEELIAKKITEIFRDKEQRMIRTIEQTIYDDKLKVYRSKRSHYEDELNDLEKERAKILKRKKNKKERMKAIRLNSRQQVSYLIKALNDTVIHYKTIYYENDFYRLKRLLDMQKIEKTPHEKQRTVQELLNNLFFSPFKEDRRFMIKYLAVETRDRLDQSKFLVDTLYFDKIFRLMLSSSDEQNTLQAYDIMCNLLASTDYRSKIRDQNYLRQVYESFELNKIDERKLEKISHMTTLVCYHSDMLPRIIECKLLSFIIKLVDPKYSVTIRSNAVLAISLLTYHEGLFHELINLNVIDLVMDLCMDPNLEISIKSFSTLALVHFALSRESIQLLLEKGIMNLFNALSTIDNAQIHTNVSWVFLALCNNGITGKQMLLNGITRDMFLVSCNPQFSQIRHLVIAGFAELGRADSLQERSVKSLPHTLQRIKEQAIVGTQEAFKRADAPNTIDVLLRFSLSDESQFKITAFWALKDYILLNADCLIDDLRGVICAFVIGAAESNDKVKVESANAISFLITHHLVFTEEEANQRADSVKAGKPEHEFNADLCYILDALMYLTGQESLEVRTRAFSTLSSLSTYASQSEHVMTQIQHDIKLANGDNSQTYYTFVEDRLAKSHAAFREKFETKNIENDFAGLYCLMRLAQEPDEAGTEEAATFLRKFYFPELDQIEAGKTSGSPAPESAPRSPLEKTQDGERGHEGCPDRLTYEEKLALSISMQTHELDERDLKLDPLNEKFFMYVFKALLYSKNRRILYQLLDVVNFYIRHETAHQSDVICPNTILWMLTIIETHKEDYDLCLLAAKTVLKVVNNHQIVFGYQEMAIIKKYNKALDQLGTQDAVGSMSSAGSKEHKNHIKETESFKMQSTSNEGVSPPVERVDASNLTMQKAHTQAPSVARLDESTSKLLERDSQKDARTPRNNAAGGDADDSPKSFDSEKFGQAIENFSKASNHSGHGAAQNEDAMRQSLRTLSKMQSGKSIKTITKEADEQVVEILQAYSQSGSNADEVVAAVGTAIDSQMSRRSDARETGARSLLHDPMMDQQRESTQSRRIFGNKSPNLKADLNGSVQVSNQVDQVLGSEDERKAELRDAIIKSFMVIFTNEKSQHLLLNKDIIDIAFSCLEHVFQISTEGKHNLARLMSIIFKFPQVQARLMHEGVILGIVYLLNMKEIHQHPDLLRNLILSCSYITLNFTFVNSKLSQHILKAMVPILGVLLRQEDPNEAYIRVAPKPSMAKQVVSTVLRQYQQESKAQGLVEKLNAENYLEQRLHSQITTPIDQRRERDNCIFAIGNLLKGHPDNAHFFIHCDGAQLIMHEVLALNAQLDSGLAREIFELTMNCLRQVAHQKALFKQFLSFSQQNLDLLPACLEKCFTISDQWFTCTAEIALFKKLFVQGEESYSGLGATERAERDQLAAKQVKRLDSQAVLNIDYKNIERLKQLEKLEEKEDRSFVMAPLCKLRNHCYQIAASCFRSNFSIDFLVVQCQLLRRMLEDLERDSLNDFIFHSLVEALRTLKKDSHTICRLFSEHGYALIALVRAMSESVSKRNTLVKTLVYLVLKAPVELCATLEPSFFGQLFALASEIGDQEILENMLWLQAALVDINTSDEQHATAIEMCTEFKSAHLFMRNLASTNESILLQALKGLKSLAAIPQFKAIILIDIGDELFPTLANILSTRLNSFSLCPLEIEVELIGFLAQITESSAATKDPLTVAAKRRAVQQGFMEHFLTRVSQIDYLVVQDVDILGDNCAAISNIDLMQVDGFRLVESNIVAASTSTVGALENDFMTALEQGDDLAKCQALPEYDPVDREEGTNRLIEHTMSLAANVTELAETHLDLVHGPGQVLNQAVAFFNRFVTQCIEVESEQVDLLHYSIGNREICKSLAQILLNLVQGSVEIQEQCAQVGVGALCVLVARSILDYELHSSIFKAMGTLALSPSQAVQTHFVDSDCCNEVLAAAENSRFFVVRRTCAKALEQTASELFELNDKLNRKKRRAKRKAANVVQEAPAIVNIQ